MYKVLIVDDEPMIREGLQTIIDWGKFGFQIAGVAVNGNEAVRRYRELKPDLILIDIRMPVKDGLQAIEEIREYDKDCHIVILSGFADFSYAKRAIGYGIDGYVLKPVEEEELEGYVERIGLLLKEKRQEGGDPETDRTTLREELLQRLAEGAIEGGDWSGSQFRPLFDGEEGVCRLVMIELYGRDHSPTNNNAIRKRLTELTSGYGLGWTFPAEPYIGIWLKGQLQQRKETEQLAGIIREACGGMLRFTAVASRHMRSLPELQGEMGAVKATLQRRFMLEGDRLYTLGETNELRHGAKGGQESAASIVEADSETIAALIEPLGQKLYYMVDIGSYEGVLKTLESAAEQLSQTAISEQGLKSAWAQMVTFVLNKATAAHPQLSLQEDLTMVTQLYMAHHYSEMLEALRRRMLDLTDKAGHADHSSVLKRITDFIDRRYYEPIKLETLAEMFNYNSGYLGKMFKGHTGESFNTYLDKVRIRYAIVLLRQGMKVRQVAERVGYANVDYFHSKFKKYKGVSPSSFKSPSGKLPGE